MKQYLLLLGGFIGFTLCFATGLAAQSDIGQILFNAAIGCLVCGILFKWLSDILFESLVIQRRKATAANEAMASAQAAQKGGKK